MFVVPVLNGAIGAEKLVRCGLTSLPPNLQPRQPLDFEPLYATDREREGSKRRAHFDTESVELGVGIDVLLRSVLPLEVNTFGLVSQCCSVSGVGGGPWLSGPSSALNAGKLSLGTRGSQLPRGGESPPSVLGSSGFISSNLRVCSVLEQPQS